MNTISLDNPSGESFLLPSYSVKESKRLTYSKLDYKFLDTFWLFLQTFEGWQEDAKVLIFSPRRGGNENPWSPSAKLTPFDHLI